MLVGGTMRNAASSCTTKGIVTVSLLILTPVSNNMKLDYLPFAIIVGIVVGVFLGGYLLRRDSKKKPAPDLPYTIYFALQGNQTQTTNYKLKSDAVKYFETVKEALNRGDAALYSTVTTADNGEFRMWTNLKMIQTAHLTGPDVNQ